MYQNIHQHERLGGMFTLGRPKKLSRKHDPDCQPSVVARLILIICQIIYQSVRIDNLADWYSGRLSIWQIDKKSNDINLADCLKKSGNWPLEIHLDLITDVVLVAVTPQQGKVDGAETAESFGAFQASLGCIEKQQNRLGTA